MNLPTRRAASALATGLLTLIAVAGCQEADPTEVKPSEFTTMTTGTAVERWEHVGKMTQIYREATPTRPGDQKALLKAFTDAAIGTSLTIIDDKDADTDLRTEAVKMTFEAFARRSKVDPKAIDDVIAATNRIEKNNPNTIVASMAAGERARVLGQIASSTPEPAKREKYADLVKAVIHAATLKPPLDKADEVLGNMAVDCEKQRLFDLALTIDKFLVERFPNIPNAKFAKGAIHRHESRGKPVDDLAGPGLDGKPISIKDYKGKVVLVVFWVSFLDAMILEMEEAEAMRARYDAKDFVVLGVDLEPNADASAALLKDKKIDWPQIVSRIKDQSMESDLSLKFGVNLPSYKMVFDREGNLVDYGFLMSDVRPALEKLLPKPKDPEPARPAAAAPGRPAATEPAKKE